MLAGGLTVNDLQKMIKVVPGPGFNRYFIGPKISSLSPAAREPWNRPWADYDEPPLYRAGG